MVLRRITLVPPDSPWQSKQISCTPLWTAEGPNVAHDVLSSKLPLVAEAAYIPTHQGTCVSGRKLPVRPRLIFLEISCHYYLHMAPCLFTGQHRWASSFESLQQISGGQRLDGASKAFSNGLSGLREHYPRLNCLSFFSPTPS